VVNGFGVEAGKPLASNKRIAKIAFTGETTTGRLIMQYASQNLIPVTLELGGKSPNIFFADVADGDDDFFDKALEGFTMFALNQGEVCTAPSRALVQESIYERFIERAIERQDTARGAKIRLESIRHHLVALTPREREVLTQVAQALSNGEIATALHLTEATVKTHVGRILAKLGMRDRVQLVVFAYDIGLVRPSPR